MWLNLENHMSKQNTHEGVISIADFIEQKIRKEKELEFYIKELNELEAKIGLLQKEVYLTQTIIEMIKSETVYDIKEEFLENNSDKLIE